MVMDWNKYHQEIGARVGDLAKLSPDTVKGYQTLSAANSKTTKLGEKTRQLISLAVAVTTRCDGCIVFHTDAALKAFTREEIVIMPFWNGRTFVLQSQGVPVDIEYIPGTMLVGNGFPILRGGKFIELTNRFINLTMDGQYQMEMTKRFYYPPSNRNAKLGPEMAKYAFPADKEKNVVAIDYEKMNAHKSQYLDRWNKEVLGA